MHILLSPTEFILWEGMGKKLLQQLLKDYAREDRWAHLALDPLAGEEDFTKPETQAIDLPLAVLEEIKGAAKTALMQTPNGTTPTLYFTDIRQGPGESFIKFIDRLTQATEKQAKHAKARQELLTKLTETSANKHL